MAEGCGPAGGETVSLRRRLAQGLEARAPGLRHDLRRAGGRLDPVLALLPLLCDRARPAVCVGGRDGGWVREVARASARATTFEPDATLWPGLRRMAGARLRLEGAVLCDHDGRMALRDAAGAARVSLLRTLDSFALGEVALIRLDIGALSRAVLDGARGMLLASRPCVMIADVARAADASALLSAAGYARLALAEGRLGPSHADAGTVLFVPGEQIELRARLAAVRFSRPRGSR